MRGKSWSFRLQRGPEDRCRAILRSDPTHVAVGRDEKQVPTTKPARTERDFPGNNLKYCEFWLGICLAALIKYPPVDSKVIAGNQCLVLTSPKSWLKVAEIDAPQRLFDVDCPRLAVQSEPVPIKDAVGRIAILLNLQDDIACTNRVESAAWNKNKTVLPARNPMKKISDNATRKS